MENVDISKIVKSNPHLDQMELTRLIEETRRLSGGKRPRYRLATIDRHRVRVVDPPVVDATIVESPVPGF